MFVIYFCHCEGYWGYHIPNVSRYIAPIYVNVFFVISGYLLFRKFLPISTTELPAKTRGAIGVQAQNILFRLMIPSILFAIAEYVPSNILQQREMSIGSFMVKTLGGGTYWFISAQVLAEFFICICLLSEVKSIWFYLGCSCFITVLGMYLAATNFTLFDFDSSFPWMYRQAMLSVVFFAFGGLYWRYESKIEKILDSWLNLLLLTAVYVFFLTRYSDAFSVTISVVDLNIPGIVISLLGVLIFIGICRKLPSIRAVQKIGRNTLGFYLLCGAVPKTLCKILSSIMPQKTFMGWGILLITSFMLTAELVFILNKFLPAVFDLRLIQKKREKEV